MRGLFFSDVAGMKAIAGCENVLLANERSPYRQEKGLLVTQEPRSQLSSRPSRELRRDRASIRLERIRKMSTFSKELSAIGHEIDSLELSQREVERSLIENSAEAQSGSIREWTNQLSSLQQELQERYEAFQILLTRKELLSTEFDQRLAALFEN